MAQTNPETLDLATACWEFGLEKKALRPKLMNLGKRSDLCQYLLIFSGENEKHAAAITDFIEEQALKKFGMKPLSVEGKREGHWTLLDYGDLIIHIFHDYVRDFYALESLWPEAEFVSVPSHP